MKSNILVQGDIGTGKTRSLITLLPQYIDERGAIHEGAGLEGFLLSVEPGAEATLGRNLCGHPKRGDFVIHQHYVPAMAVPWDTYGSFIELANSLPMDTLLKTSDPNKKFYRQFIHIFDGCKEFVCDHCGENFGDVADWGEERAIALDSLTGLTKAAIQNLVGGKPVRSLPETGTVMEFIEGFLDLFWGGTKCSAILLAHIDREISPITGLSTMTVHTIGQKLAPRIVKKPDETVRSYTDEDRYWWSNIKSHEGDIVKRRRLPYSADITPDFTPIFKDD